MKRIILTLALLFVAGVAFGQQAQASLDKGSGAVISRLNLGGANPNQYLSFTDGFDPSTITGFGIEIYFTDKLFRAQITTTVPTNGWTEPLVVSSLGIDFGNISGARWIMFLTTTAGDKFINTDHVIGLINGNAVTAIPGDGNFPLDTVSIDPLDSPTISGSPQNQNVTEGSFLTFTVNATSALAGVEPTYQWFFNGNPIPGARQSSFSISSVSGADAGTYGVEVTDPLGSISLTATLTVNGTPNVPAASFPALFFLLLSIGALGGRRVLQLTK